MMIKTAVARSALAGLGVALVCGQAIASDFNFAINDDTLEAGLFAPASNASRVSAEYFYHDDDGKTLGLGYQVTSGAGEGDDIALGGKLVKLWSDKRENGHVFAIGGDYGRPITDQVSLVISAYYAPSVLSFSGIDRYYNADVKLAYKLMPTADLFVGYRDIHFKFDHQHNMTLEQGGYLGARLKF